MDNNSKQNFNLEVDFKTVFPDGYLSGSPIDRFETRIAAFSVRPTLLLLTVAHMVLNCV